MNACLHDALRDALPGVANAVTRQRAAAACQVPPDAARDCRMILAGLPLLVVQAALSVYLMLVIGCSVGGHCVS